MPHQCLKCGKIFKEGSAQLLKGCPECEGNRFFFTKEPLDEKQRKKITEDLSQDINSAIMELMGSESGNVVKKTGDWVNIKPKDVKKALEKRLPKKDKLDIEKKDDINILIDDNYRFSEIEKVKSMVDKSDRPETIDIERSGSYKIDIKGLLEEEPIIPKRWNIYNSLTFSF